MQPHSSTSPFGRRSLTLAHVARQATAKARSPEKAVHKWQVFRAICTAKARIGVSERALAVLDALLTFHPETTLSGEGPHLVVQGEAFRPLSLPPLGSLRLCDLVGFRVIACRAVPL